MSKQYTFEELQEICLGIEPVESMSSYTRQWHMMYSTPRHKEVWSYVAPRGKWLLRLLIIPAQLLANALMFYLVYLLITSSGIPILGSFQL